MQTYIGLDVSLKATSICVADQERRVVWPRIASRTAPRQRGSMAGEMVQLRVRRL